MPMTQAHFSREDPRQSMSKIRNPKQTQTPKVESQTGNPKRAGLEFCAF
jgi:hypothetical protein